MANKTRSPEMINFQKQQMSRAAQEIIVKEGYGGLSIRKLSSRLDISQSTIYNYFKNRDEIYIYVLNNGFEMLHRELVSAGESIADPVERLRRMCRVSYSFGIREPDLVFIMLVLDTPKYLDYLETDYEPFMRIELSNALRCREVFSRTVAEISKAYRTVPKKDIEYRTFVIITQLIGLITVHNNKLINYMAEDGDVVIGRMLDDIVRPLAVANAGGSARRAFPRGKGS